MKLSGKRIIVTGGAGFIGSHLVDALLEGGSAVRVIDNFSAGRRENLVEASQCAHCEVAEADVCDRAKMVALTRDFDVVFHLAIQCLRVSINDPWSNHEVNATGTLSMLDAAKKNNVQRFIYVSSSEVYGTAQTVPMIEEHPKEPITVYGASKLAGELYTNAYHRTYDLNTTIVRPFNTYGPREHYLGKSAEVIPRFFTRITNDQPVTLFGDGTQTRDFTYIDDTVRGLIAAAESDQLNGDTINIARGQEVEIMEIAQKLASILRKELKIDYLPERPGDVQRHFSSIEKAHVALGYAPQVDIDQGLQKYVAWCRQSGIDWMKVNATFPKTNW